MSEAEPELGLGTIVRVDDRSVTVRFSAIDETRRYAVRSAPLRRVRFTVGDLVTAADGCALRVEAVEDEGTGLLVYRCGDRALTETELSDRVTLSGPRERLAAGRVDDPEIFALRRECLRRLHDLRRSPVRGFRGPRIELLLHQFYVASEIASRVAPRVLLADETGLGKTIEAGLAISRLLLSGRAARVLILVPDSLVHQWLVELRRRFSLRFAIFDAERCAAIEESDPDANPFASEQLVLAGINMLVGDERRISQAAAAGWDVLVVDEAHHLVWHPGHPSEEYAAVEQLAREVQALLLLSATPEQLGEDGHFARLRLLDPHRYEDLESWRLEAAHYREAARLGAVLASNEEPTPTDAERLADILETTAEAVVTAAGDEDRRRRMLGELIDRHGPGRVMFRNTRRVLTGLPSRQLHLHPLDPPAADPHVGDRLAEELAQDLGRGPVSAEPHFEYDPRVGWLVETLSRGSPSKLLVVCRSTGRAQAIKSAVEAAIKVDVALFHEGLTLVQRDRNAAWFAQPDGARLLVCSEIGSEGRNFQHVQDLVMFDLPLDPDLVEQRIGRLDRIGQRGDVRVHMPFVRGSGQECLVRWHHEGVGSFERATSTSQPLLEQFGESVCAVASDAARGIEIGDRLERLIGETATARRDLLERVHAGRDRLLEMASLRADIATALIAEVSSDDEDPEIDEFFLRLLEHFHLYAEEIGPRTYLLNPDAMCTVDFPTLESGERAITFDRNLALVREDFEFITWDHPLMQDALELLIGSEAGNAVFVRMDADEAPSLILDATFVLESIAPLHLHVDRFLPPTPIPVLTDQRLSEPPDGSAWASQLDRLEPGRPDWLSRHRAVVGGLIAKMTAAAEGFAERRAAEIRARAQIALRATLAPEIDRLNALAEHNDQVRPEEIVGLRRELAELDLHITRARLRLDSARLIWRGPRES